MNKEDKLYVLFGTKTKTVKCIKYSDIFKADSDSDDLKYF